MCELLSIKLTFLLAGAAALLVGIELGLQQTFNDIISGIIILAEGSLKKNDVVDVDNLIGKVNEINMRLSEIVTRDWIFILVPNHKLINEYHSRATRFMVNVGVAYDSDVDLVRRNYKNVKKMISVSSYMIQKYFTLSVRIINVGDNFIDFEILFWRNEIFHIEQVKSNLRFSILQTFKEKNITIPFLHGDIHFKNKTNF